MADSSNGGSKFQPPKEMSMELRLLLALLLTVPILFIGPYFFGSQTPAKKNPATKPAAQTASQPEKPAAPAPRDSKAVAAASVAASVATAGGHATPQQPLPF